VAGRIQHDTPSSGVRLFIGPAGPQPDGLRFGRVQIADLKIEMQLFRDRAARPGRRLVTGHPQCRDRDAFIGHHDGIVAYRRHFTAEEPGPERCETSRVLTIEADHSQASQCHTRDANTRAGSGSRSTSGRNGIPIPLRYAAGGRMIPL
jgi:hypothetical protein